ncbi:polyprotein of EF-Ts [Citrus sinensis]|nr:polyprotein of EF-Ts [Citrus sinensis]
MTPVIPCSISSISSIPVTAFTIKKNNCLTRYNSTRKSTKQTISSQRFLLPLPSSVRFFSQFQSGSALQHKFALHIISATGINVSVEESDSPTADDDSVRASDIPSDVETSESSSIKSEASPTLVESRRSRISRKSEMPPIKNEDLIPGATFTRKVRSIQPFGAFIDFRAFTDGLVHVSRLSDNFVKDVGSIVSVGQEVKVRLIEANAKTGRISLTMSESDDISMLQQQKDATASGDKVRTARRSTSKPGQKRDEMKTTKFVKGQDLEGTVKNLTRSSAFISLPEGEEGFLPTSEESDDGFANMMGGSSLQVGQEVSVRVLRISRGQVTLTMKKEDDVGLNLQLTQGVIHAATNPFVLAFRSNKDISSFLDERDKSATAGKKLEKPTPIEIGGEVSQMEAGSSIPKVQDQPTSSDNGMASVPSIMSEIVEDDEAPSKEKDELADITNRNEDPQNVMSGSPETLDAEQALSTDGPKAGEFTESQTKDTIAKDEVQILTPATEEKETEDTTEALAPEGSVSTEKQIIGEAASTNLSGEIAEQVSVFDSPKDEEVVQNQTDDVIAKDEEQIQTPTTESEIPSAGSLKEKESGPIPDKNGSIISSGEEPDISSSQKTKATVSPALVKQLCEETGAGMMDCKKALVETGGDIIKAQEFLRKKGLASAEKKASRATAEGRIGSYIYDSRIGVMVEVNCETDFVSQGDIFKELVDDLAMQVVACPQVKYIVTEDVPEEILNKEKEIEMQKEDLLSKPEQIRSKIVEGRIRKRLEELALLEQPYIKNDKMVGLEKKSQDFAAEVAAQTAAKPIAKEQPAPAETKETVEKPPAVAVSAALVKQLREETGAGMMDCKKALSETRGDLEKAQEYLRKKGLSSADKKSGRLTAEGRIGSYIHDSRIGVLIEVNCEIDFVGRSEKFKELVDDLAMQVVACPQVQFISIEDILEDIINKEKEIEMQREDLISKPENIRERIIEGRIIKRLGELALSEQPFIKDDSVLVKDLVKQTVAAIGENIKVRRFVRFTLGETYEETQTETEA